MADTSESHFSELSQAVNTYKTKWEIFGNLAAANYAAAYQQQKSVLKKVRAALEAQKKDEEAMMTFALSLLTVGVAGALAGACVNRLVVEEGAGVIKKAL